MAGDTTPRDSRELLQCVALEDGIPALFEVAESQGEGLAGLRAQLTAIQLVLTDLAAAAQAPPDDPCCVGEESPEALLALAEQAHAVLNQAAAVRAAAVARFARWGPESDRVTAPRRAHPLGHCDEWAADTLAPHLDLGTYEAQSLVHESAWMLTRTPRLFADVGRGGANHTTVAAMARELQEARPDSCERVEEVARRRGVHRRPRSAARRSTRALVTTVEAAAARRTATRTLAQQTGVWLDTHPTPGLSLLTAALPTAQAEALMAAVDDAAHRSATSTSSTTTDERTAGQHRADALVGMALRNVRLTAHLEYVTSPDGSPSEHPSPAAGAPVPGASPDDRDDRHDLDDAILIGRSGVVEASAVHALLATYGGRLTTSVASAAEAADGYRPTAALRAAVRRRDGRCRFPGCTRAVRYTDLDHVLPWPQGRTEATNLQCLCRRHHRAKHARWTVRMDTAGACTWIDPAGRTTTTHPSRQEDLADLAALRGPPAGDRRISPRPELPSPSPAAPG